MSSSVLLTVHNHQLGLSGAITSIAPSASVLASTCLDRYTRIHSVFPPPSLPGQPQEGKGMVVDKIFMNSTPTVIAWDQNEVSPGRGSQVEEPEEPEDDVWNAMKRVGAVNDFGLADRNRPEQ